MQLKSSVCELSNNFLIGVATGGENAKFANQHGTEKSLNAIAVTNHEVNAKCVASVDYTYYRFNV